MASITCKNSAETTPTSCVTYVERDPGDRVVEAARDGFDTIRTSTSFTLAVNSFIEALFASPGSQSIDLVGSVIANQIKGNAGLNAINGSGGGGALWGGNGRDKFVFDVRLVPSARHDQSHRRRASLRRH